MKLMRWKWLENYVTIFGSESGFLCWPNLTTINLLRFLMYHNQAKMLWYNLRLLILFFLQIVLYQNQRVGIKVLSIDDDFIIFDNTIWQIILFPILAFNIIVPIQGNENKQFVNFPTKINSRKYLYKFALF